MRGFEYEVRNLETESSSERVRQIGKLLRTKAFRNEVSKTALANLKFLQEGDEAYNYPGCSNDQLSEPDCIHKHRNGNLTCLYFDPRNSSCKLAKDAECDALGCRT